MGMGLANRRHHTRLFPSMDGSVRATAGFRSVTTGVILLAQSVGAITCVANAEPVDFETQIAPIFTRHCISCHDASAPEGSLDLTQRAHALAGGDSGQVIEPGKADGSYLLELIVTDKNGQADMPQQGSPLSADQVELIRRWIDEGASWPEALPALEPMRGDKTWWSLQPIQETPPPVNEAVPDRWNVNPIDRFVLASMRQHGLAPANEADRQTLVRRLTFDLTGLPPTPEDIDDFVNDPSDNAYENLAERLLGSSAYGERWGRHWLDVIRFGESGGYERNHLRDNAWPFRDYVIESFNNDKPFDRLIMEHLAGDQIGPGDPAIEVGTGFLVAGSYDDVNNQDPAAKAVIRSNTLDDIISATGAAFLGLTINCTRCHDHKFDPILQADYYRLQSTFAGVKQGQRELASSQQRAALSKQRRPLATELEGVRNSLKALKQIGKERIGDQRDSLIARLFPRPAVHKYRTEETFDPVQARFVRMTITRTTGNGNQAATLDEFEIFTPLPQSRNVALASAGGIASVSSMRYSNDDPDAYGAHHLNDGKFTSFWIAGRPDSEITIELSRIETISKIVWSVDRIESFPPTQGRTFTSEYRIDISLDGTSWTQVADHLGRLPLEAKRLEDLLLLEVLDDHQRAEFAKLTRREQYLQYQQNQLAKLPTAWIGIFQQPAEVTKLAIGGDPTKLGKTISPASLSTLDQVVATYKLDENAQEGKRREALARWIVSDNNPLTARVLANRIWHYHFGRGIVATPSDFGFKGARPTHPELLDWLATQLKRNAWQIKPLHRLIVHSQTYRQSSRYEESFGAIDADAVYLWRFPPQRLTAEAIRDSILAIAGKLDRTMGGPGFRLYDYTVDNVATYYPLDKIAADTYRRAVYHQNPRAMRVDLLGHYDMPECSLPSPKRDITVTPSQSLAMMNHSFMIDMSEAFADRLQKEVGESDIPGQVTRAFRIAFGRSPEPEELNESARLVADFGLPVFCRAIFNANELLYVR